MLLGQSACGTPDLIITAAGFPVETRWLDVIMWQLLEEGARQQSTDSRQLIDALERDQPTFYKIGITNLDREKTYLIFVAAFKDDGSGKPCLLNSVNALQDPGWSLVGDILIPFFPETELPQSGCFQPKNASPSWPTEMPFIANVSLAITAFDGMEPKDIPSLKIRGWNFMLGDIASVVFSMPPTQPPTVKSRVVTPELIEWSVQPSASARLTVQDMTVERDDKSASHTVTLGIDLPKLF